MNNTFVAVIKVHNDWESTDVVDELRFYENVSLQEAFSMAYQVGQSKAKELVEINWISREVCIVDVRVARLVPGSPVNVQLDRTNDDNFKSSFEHVTAEYLD